MDTCPDRFARSLVRAEGRLLIYSVCLECGEGQLVSRSDGSLGEWEDGHQCKKKPMAVAAGDAGAKSA
ncbi:MAG TPA: hypothetical protein VHU89_03765 [Acidobacteriaceae bacterium]|jgi:hypothetical protein|nr:hypothetical protein [Acidobacteriaceae bacterium]